MTRKFGIWNEEFIGQVEEYYLSHRANLSELADKSMSLFGTRFDLETVKVWAAEGNWLQKKTRDGSGDNINQEVNVIRRALFQQIIADSEGGILVRLNGNDDPRKLIRSLRSMGLEAEFFSPTGLETSVVNAYMNLLSKANFDLGKQASLKTSQQKALELLRTRKKNDD